ncbi:hypothetical protein [Streptomyces canarius]
MNARVVQQPEFLLFQAHQQFDDDGRLPEDSPARQMLRAVLDALTHLAISERQQALTGASVH